MSLLVEPINNLVSDSDLKRSSIPDLILIGSLSGTNKKYSILKAFSETLPHYHHALKILLVFWDRFGHQFALSTLMVTVGWLRRPANRLLPTLDPIDLRLIEYLRSM